MARDRDQVLSGLLADLPTGWAWRRRPDSVLARLLAPLTAELAGLEASMERLLAEADPRSTDLLLAEWERAFGLPDECSGEMTLLAARRAALLARITEHSSPTPAALIALAGAFGVEAGITEHHAHTTEHDTEDPVTDEEWAYVWTMFAPGLTIVERTTEDDTETPLMVWSAGPHECAVRRRAPAHTLVRFGLYTGDWEVGRGALPAGVTLRRASAGTHHSWRGTLLESAADVPRWDYDPALIYNLVPNPWGDGAAPPTLPGGGWFSSNAGSVTITFLGRGERDGIPTTQWRITGTANNNGFPAIGFVPSNAASADRIPASIGETWNGQFHVQVIREGTTNTRRDLRIAMRGYSATNSLVDNSVFSIPWGRTFADGPVRCSRTMTSASTVTAALMLVVGSAIGEVHDYDIEVGFPVLNRGASYLADTVPLTTLAHRIDGVPQYGLRGLIFEPASQNVISNPRLEGAVADTPGTAPTGWQMGGTLNGITQQIVGLVQLGDLVLMDVRYSGTATANYLHNNFFHSGAGLAVVSPGQTWTGSAYASPVAGVLPTIADLIVIERTSGGTALVTVSKPLDPTIRLMPARPELTRTIASPTAARAHFGWRVGFTVGASYDFTLRIGGPQFEMLACATSLMQPPVGVPGMSSREGETIVLDVPDGGYRSEVRAGTRDTAGTSYAGSGLLATGGFGLPFAMPAAALAAGERHLQHLKVRKVS